MRSQRKSVSVWLNNSNCKFIIAVGLTLTMFFLSCNANASDLLANTMGDVKDTLNGTGKKWIVMIDAAISLGAFAMTKILCLIRCYSVFAWV
jgi:hypothetical protein